MQSRHFCHSLLLNWLTLKIHRLNHAFFHHDSLSFTFSQALSKFIIIQFSNKKIIFIDQFLNTK